MIDAPYAATEREMTLAYLQRQRQLVCWKVTGLDDEAARKTSTASGLTIHWLVWHLGGAEHWWLSCRLAGHSPEDGDPGLDPDTATLAELIDAYRDECRRSDEIIAAHQLDDVAVGGPPQTLRWMLQHLIEETSRHLGHLDLLCEQADGRTGEAPE